MSTETKTALTLLLPLSLHEKLRAAAKRNNRSVTGELRHLIQQAHGEAKP